MLANLLAIWAQARPVDVNPLVALCPLFFLLLLIFPMIAGMWRIFEKAGEPGWMSIILILNIFILLKIAGKPGWWILLFFIPFVGIIIAILVWIDVAKNFGKGGGFVVGLILL